ncbi:hypothetical protein BBJ28_00021322 [Nothophytophthora sp. Chile5]|nr:hypothetical protein BBJ28_00021322 [Nothophytophthora sp. Chile5]
MKGLAQDVAQWVPKLALEDKDADLLRELADTLVAHNIESYNTLLVSPDGHADVRRWKELRRKDGIRVYKERSGAIATTSGREVTLPCIPSLLLLGTIVGRLDDLMFAVAASTDEAMKITSKCVQDGVLDCKVVQQLVQPTEQEPFRHASVKWRLNSARDYVCVDTTGIAESSQGERVGYSISHSVAFSQIPSFAKFGVERANMSVCSLYRQKTPETIECYARGFFDFRSDSNELLNNLSMNSVATQWLSLSKYVECAEMKKLVWRLRKNSGLPTTGPMDVQPIEEDEAREPQDTDVEKSKQSALSNGKCAVCTRSFGFSHRKTCKICLRSVCSSCTVKKLVCVMAPDRRTVLDKKRTFCTMCMCEVTQSDALAIARDEIRSATTLPKSLRPVQQTEVERQPQDDELELTKEGGVVEPYVL